MLNGFPWTWTKIIVISEIPPKYCISDSSVDCDGYSISCLGFFPSVAYTVIIWIEFALSCPFQFTYFDVHPCHLLFDHMQFTLIHSHNIPGSHTVLFFAASDFAFTTRYIYSWVSFPLWPSCFILSGAAGCCLSLFLSSMLDTFQPGGSPSGIISVSVFILCMGVSRRECWSGLLFSPPVYLILSTLSPVTSLSWVALTSIAQSFITLHKLLCHNKTMTVL